MARVIVDAHEHGRIKAMAEMILNAEVEPLAVVNVLVISLIRSMTTPSSISPSQSYEAKAAG